MNYPDVRIDLEIWIEYGQVYIYDRGLEFGEDPEVVLKALDDAQNSGRYVGKSGPVIDLCSPVQSNFNAPMRVETWASEPPAEFDGWDHIVDIDLDLPTGRLVFEQSGAGPGDEKASCEVPGGRYRARISGRGYDHTDPTFGGEDSYQIQLWPRGADREPALLKSWPGWEALHTPSSQD